jgi:hypothetical protein
MGPEAVTGTRQTRPVDVSTAIDQQRTRDRDFGTGTATLAARVRAVAGGLNALEHGAEDAGAGLRGALVDLAAAATELAELRGGTDGDRDPFAASTRSGTDPVAASR